MDDNYHGWLAIGVINHDVHGIHPSNGALSAMGLIFVLSLDYISHLK
jgi:hypothetical protein